MILLHSHRPSVAAIYEDREPSHPMSAAGVLLPEVENLKELSKFQSKVEVL